jgi:hypothetical protein
METPMLHQFGYFLSSLCAFALGAFLPLVLHEAGHILGGLAAGFRFFLFIVGPFQLERTSDRLKFSWNKKLSLSGGLAGCVPKTFGPNLRKPMLSFVLGGPAASALGAFVLWPLFTLGVPSEFLWNFLFAFGIASAGIALTAIVPSRLAGFTSDGARALMLLRRDPKGERWVAMMGVIALSMVERPREWPEELVKSLGDCQDVSFDAAYSAHARYLHCRDRGDIVEAGAWIDCMLARVEGVPRAFRGPLYAAAADFQARYRNDATRSRELLGLAEKAGGIDGPPLYLVRAAVAIAEGRNAEALQDLARAEPAIDSQPPSLRPVLREYLTELRAACEAA